MITPQISPQITSQITSQIGGGGVARWFTKLNGTSFFTIPTYQASGDFDWDFYIEANTNGFFFTSSVDNSNRVAISPAGDFVFRANGVEVSVTPSDLSWFDDEIHRGTIRRRSGTVSLYIDLVDVGASLSNGEVATIEKLGEYSGATGIPDLVGFMYNVRLTGATNLATYPSGITSWALSEQGSENGFVYADTEGLGNNATGTNIIAADEFTSVNDSTQGYNVIILAGQSTMVGRATLQAGVDDDYTAIAGTTYQYAFHEEGILDATNPILSNDPANDSMGLWLELVEGIQSSFDSRPLLLIAVAEGGTGFSTNDWNKGDAAYESAVKRINDVMRNEKNTMQGMFWLQGENDADSGSTTYQADITAMWNDMAIDCDSISDSTKFVCAQIKGSTTPANVPVINAALASFVASIPNGGIVSTGDLTLFDTYHFDAPSTRTIGQRMSTSYLGL